MVLESFNEMVLFQLLLLYNTRPKISGIKQPLYYAYDWFFIDFYWFCYDFYIFIIGFIIDSVDQKFWKSTVGDALLCSTLSWAPAGD